MIRCTYMTEITHQNTPPASVKAAIRRHQLERLSNMGGYLNRVAAQPITEANRHEELSWSEEQGREAID